jgi:hypothetical protein
VVNTALDKVKIWKIYISKPKMSQDANIDDVQEPVNSAPPEVRRIIERVWKLEKGRLDKKINSHINDNILDIIKEEVR